MKGFPKMLALIITVLLAIAPISEVRGAIPYALSQGIEMPWALLIPFLANASIVPVLYMIVRPLFDFFRNHFGKVGQWVDRLETRAANKFREYQKYTLIGLFLFVAIPLPGTGIYTGIIAAVVTQVPARIGVLSIIAGTFVASVITYLVSTGFIHFLDFMF